MKPHILEAFKTVELDPADRARLATLRALEKKLLRSGRTAAEVDKEISEIIRGALERTALAAAGDEDVFQTLKAWLKHGTRANFRIVAVIERFE